MKKFAQRLAVNLLSFFRTLLVMVGVVAWVEKEWIGVILVLLAYELTTHWLGKALDPPTSEDIQMAISLFNKLYDEVKTEDE